MLAGLLYLHSVQQNTVFDTNVVASSPNNFLVTWEAVGIAKCVKIWVDGWTNHISMRAGLFARIPESADVESQEFVAKNPQEDSRTYSSIFGNDAIGTGHCRIQLDSQQAWSAAANNNSQWMIVKLDSIYKVNGAYFQCRNRVRAGYQIVTAVSFETSKDCKKYDAVENGTIFETGVMANEEVKRLVQWQEDIDAQCVKILVKGWLRHISMRVGISGSLKPVR